LFLAINWRAQNQTGLRLATCVTW